MMNLVFVLLFTFLVAGILIYFIAAHDRRRDQQKFLLQMQHPEAVVATMDFREFNKLCLDICEGLKLEVQDVTQPESGEFSIRATSANPITKVEYLIACFHLPHAAALDTQRIIEVSDQVVSERISKGIIITTGRIHHVELRHLPELAALELIDGQRLLQLKEEYRFI